MAELEEPRPYPGYNACSSPRPAARVKPEAEEYANRGRGSLDLFTNEPKYIDEPKLTPRCPTNSARQNYEIGRNGTVSNLLNGQATPRADTTYVPRVKPEAEDIAYAHAGKGTKQLFDSYGNHPRSARAVPRVKPEAEETSEKHQGGRMNCLLHDPKKLPVSARPVPRVKGDGQETADLDKGGQMSKTIHQYATPLSHRAVPRVKPEAEENAEKGKGLTGSLMTNYGKLPRSARPEPKVKPEGQEMANLDKGGRLSRLIHEGHRLPQDPKPIPRATGAARHILKAHRGQMGQIFAAQTRHTIVQEPGLSRNTIKMR